MCIRCGGSGRYVGEYIPATRYSPEEVCYEWCDCDAGDRAVKLSLGMGCPICNELPEDHDEETLSAHTAGARLTDSEWPFEFEDEFDENEPF